MQEPVSLSVRGHQVKHIPSPGRPGRCGGIDGLHDLGGGTYTFFQTQSPLYQNSP